MDIRKLYEKNGITLHALHHLHCIHNKRNRNNNHQSTIENNRVNHQITLAKLRTYFIKNPHQNLLLTLVSSLLLYPVSKATLEYMNCDKTLWYLKEDDKFEVLIGKKMVYLYEIPLITLSDVAPIIFFLSKLFYDSYQTKKYITKQDALIAKFKNKYAALSTKTSENMNVKSAYFEEQLKKSQNQIETSQE